MPATICRPAPATKPDANRTKRPAGHRRRGAFRLSGQAHDQTHRHSEGRTSRCPCGASSRASRPLRGRPGRGARFAFARRYAYRTRNGRVGPSRRHLQRQLQLCPRRREPGAEPARRLSAAPGRDGAGLFADHQDARLPADRRSDRPSRRPRSRAARISDRRRHTAARAQGPSRLPAQHPPRRQPGDHRPPRGDPRPPLGPAGDRLGPHPLRDLSALLRHGLPGAGGAGGRCGASTAAATPSSRRRIRWRSCCATRG